MNLLHNLHPRLRLHFSRDSQTGESKARSALKKLGHKPETQTVNIPTAKGPLIEWLNENVTA